MRAVMSSAPGWPRTAGSSRYRERGDVEAERGLSRRASWRDRRTPACSWNRLRRAYSRVTGSGRPARRTPAALDQTSPSFETRATETPGTWNSFMSAGRRLSIRAATGANRRGRGRLRGRSSRSPGTRPSGRPRRLSSKAARSAGTADAASLPDIAQGDDGGPADVRILVLQRLDEPGDRGFGGRAEPREGGGGAPARAGAFGSQGRREGPNGAPPITARDAEAFAATYGSASANEPMSARTISSETGRTDPRSAAAFSRTSGSGSLELLDQSGDVDIRSICRPRQGRETTGSAIRIQANMATGDLLDMGILPFGNLLFAPMIYREARPCKAGSSGAGEKKARGGRLSDIREQEGTCPIG